MAKDARAVELISLGDKLYTDKRQLDSLSQEIAWQFCPDLASFTTKLVLGQDFAIDRMDSSPEQVSRELTNQLSAMLRPTDRDWFKVTTLNEEIDADEANARYLEYIGRTVRQGLYDPRSKFVRATKQADRFYVNFGQAVISVEEAPKTRDHLFFRCFHLKNCAWIENDKGDVDHLHRKETMTARAMVQRFSGAGDSLAQEIKRAAEKEPSKEFEIRVVVMPADEYDLTKSGSGTERVNRRNHPYIIAYIDATHGKVIRESPIKEFIYVVPRWNMFSDTPYAFSPCSMIALPDARMAQMMNQILLEAGEKAVDPPLVAKAEIVLGEPNLQAGGISWIDMEHDDTLKNALDAIHLAPDMKVGFEMRKDLREVLAKAFFIDKLALPEPNSKMTAYEVGRRLEEHVRNLLPLFEPMQIEYNTRLLDKAYNTQLNMNKFRTDGSNGTPPMPAALRAADVTWAFQSPIQDAMERIMVEQFKGSLELVQLGLQAGAKASPLNTDRALKDAVRGTGAPAIWRMTADEMTAQAQQIAQAKAEQTQMTALSQGAQIAEHGGKAAAHLAGAAQTAGLLPPPAQKAVQGSAQGAPELAGALGLNPADVGDQGAPVNPNEATPPPWMPQQTAAVLAAAKGQAQPGGLPSQAGPAQLQSAASPGPSLQDIMLIVQRTALQVRELEDRFAQPRSIRVHRDAKGKITGATANA